MAIAEHYPKDFQEFINQFKGENDCWQYIFELRWPNGYACSKCNGNKYWLTEKNMIHCTSAVTSPPMPMKEIVKESQLV